MTQPTKEQLIAARDRLNNSIKEDYENGEEMVVVVDSYLTSQDIKTILSLLDSHINQPDLDATIAQCIEHAKRDWKEGSFGYNEAEIVVDTVRLLAPRIVRDGCVVVDANEYQQPKNIQNALQANINMIAASKGD